MKSSLVTGFMLLMFTSLPVQVAAHPAGDVVKSTTENVLERLEQEREQLEKHPERLYDLVHELILPNLDFVGISRWVLGRGWRDATTEQREQFQDEFQTMLIRTYARALLEYSGQEIRYQPVREDPESNMVVVRTEFLPSGSQPIPVNYRMHQRDGDWKVIDVAINGVSLVATYRNSFASELRRNGLDNLIAQLADRNARGQHEVPEEVLAQ